MAEQTDSKPVLCGFNSHLALHKKEKVKMDKRMSESLGWKKDGELEDEDDYCEEDCSKCKMNVNYTMFDQEDDGDID